MISKPHVRHAVMILAVSLLATTPRRGEAKPRLESICTVYGQHEVKLTGIGLVVGLNNTGDGGKNLPATRALARTLNLMNTPTVVDELKDAKNFAIVLIEATIPRAGLRRGQKIDCFVSSMMGAKSLRGGRLLVSPVETAEVKSEEVVGLASGAVRIEDPAVLTSGKISGGVAMERNFVVPFIDKDKGNVITLLLAPTHASFRTAGEVARVINQEFSFEANNQQIARAVSANTIQVEVPEYRRDSPVEFVAQVLEIGIEDPQTQARVVINEKTKTVIVTGEVEIAPVVISHNGLSVQVGGGTDAPAQPFTSLVGDQSRQSNQRLKELVEALNQLQVPTEDVIKIIRQIHRSGKLHAILDDQ